MKWRMRRSRESDDQIVEQEEQLAAAELEAADLIKRATKAAAALNARLGRNHWGQTVADITRTPR